MAAKAKRPTDLTDAFERALSWANTLHRGQTRKGTDIPYVSHLLAVTSLVLEDGGTEEDAIAALLHDAIEDCEATLLHFEKALGAELGARIYATVDACSDGLDNLDTRDETTWLERKRNYVHHLADPDIPDDVLRVTIADKLHNARSILADLRAHGPGVWDKFNAGMSDQLWYYRSLTDTLTCRYPRPMTSELATVVAEIGRIAEQHDLATELTVATPDHLDCFIGGFMATSYRVHLDSGALIHETLEHYEPTDLAQNEPEPSDWEQFWTSLDTINAWQWSGDYRNPEVMDGTNWSIRILHGTRLLAASGSNSYPPIGDTTEPSPAFEAFLAAISRIAGRPFA
ncbi:MAG: HD domain-containing protein [Acidimicrobiia bacterium]|nr:HD domain-containing protein [Acidimicrobiia bacterium]